MKYILSLSVLLYSVCISQAQIVQGAWKMDKNGTHTIVLLMDNYATISTYTDSSFLSTWGGPYSVDKNKLIISKEFDTENAAETGSSKHFGFTFLNPDSLHLISENGNRTFHLTRIDDAYAPLAGVWKITGRMENGTLNQIHQTGPRKTLKMLTGNRFQWFAINPETKEFFGTGGGTYTFEDGKYTENILFFSRDNSRVGSSLQFDGKLENHQWHHSGLSSKGDKINEVWSRDM